MSVPLLHRSEPTLSDLVDAIAVRSGAWVVVERFGAVLTHGSGRFECPSPVATSLLAKTTDSLRSGVVWERGSQPLTGVLAGVSVVALDLGEGATAWFVGGPVDPSAAAALAAAVHGDGVPLCDPVVQELLHPRGPARRGRAPEAVLVVLQAEEGVAAVSRRCGAAVAGTGARVHAEDDVVVVALAVGSSPADLVREVRATCPTAVAGVLAVPEDASDWARTFGLARAAAFTARGLGLSVADCADPTVATELVVQEAQQAAADLVRDLPAAPLQRLRDYDARTSGDLIASLSAWCGAGFDVPTAAAAVHVHANTLRYRIRRASTISGLDLTQPRQLLALQLLLAV